MYQLRQYQQEAKDAILQEWDAGSRKLLLVLPTGCGKTIVFSSVVESEVHDGKRVLILAHRSELLEQAADKLKAACGLDSALEKAESTALGNPLMVTVGSVQSLAGKRLESFPPDYYDDIVVDEAHHCLSDSYQKVLEHFPNARILGVTATPDRGDRKNLGQYFDKLAYEYSLKDAIESGYLVPIQAEQIPLQIDLSQVGISNGDYAVGEIGTALDPYLEQIADEMMNYRNRKTVVFLPLIATSQKFCEMLNDRGLKAAEVNGMSGDRAEILEAFDRGEYNVLCNSMLLTEGWDCPSVDCVVVLRPTKVRALYCQMVGRGTRLAEGKKELLVLDFLWMTDRHDLCRPSSLIAKDEETKERMDKLIEESGSMDVLDAEEQAIKDVIAERENALRRELEAMRRRKRKSVDPIQYAFSINAEDLVNYVPVFAWEMGPATDKQIKFLEGRGILPDAVTNKGLATKLIDRIVTRTKEGYCTPKQIKLLERYGFQRVGEWSFDSASKMISRLAMVNWQVPRGIDPSTYVPKDLSNAG